MFKHLLAPLDGSQLAECALPAAARLAQQLGATVTLFHVVEFKAPSNIHGQPHLTTPERARAYLADVTDRFFSRNAMVAQHVHISPAVDVAQSIVAHREELHADLIVMCAHGSNSLHTRLFGSIAQKVIVLGTTPVLLVNSERTARMFACRRLLVPLDGNPEHELGLAVATELAQSCQAQIHLVVVIPTPRKLSPMEATTGKLLPSAMATVLDYSQRPAFDYLQSKQAAFGALNLTISCAVKRGDPVDVVLATAEATHSDVIVLGTHGKNHLDAFWSGSITPRLVADSRWPLLLVPL